MDSKTRVAVAWYSKDVEDSRGLVSIKNQGCLGVAVVGSRVYGVTPHYDDGMLHLSLKNSVVGGPLSVDHYTMVRTAGGVESKQHQLTFDPDNLYAGYRLPNKERYKPRDHHNEGLGRGKAYFYTSDAATRERWVREAPGYLAWVKASESGALDRIDYNMPTGRPMGETVKASIDAPDVNVGEITFPEFFVKLTGRGDITLNIDQGYYDAAIDKIARCAITKNRMSGMLKYLGVNAPSVISDVALFEGCDLSDVVSRCGTSLSYMRNNRRLWDSMRDGFVVITFNPFVSVPKASNANEYDQYRVSGDDGDHPCQFMLAPRSAFTDVGLKYLEGMKAKVDTSIVKTINLTRPNGALYKKVHGTLIHADSRLFWGGEQINSPTEPVLDNIDCNDQFYDQGSPEVDWLIANILLSMRRGACFNLRLFSEPGDIARVLKRTAQPRTPDIYAHLPRELQVVDRHREGGAPLADEEYREALCDTFHPLSLDLFEEPELHPRVSPTSVVHGARRCKTLQESWIDMPT